MTRDDLVKQCRIDTWRVGNLVSVEVTHLATGFVEREKDAKSQFQAKEACLWRLGQRLVPQEEVER